MGKAVHLQRTVHHMHPGLCVSPPDTQLRHPGSSLPHEHVFFSMFPQALFLKEMEGL